MASNTKQKKVKILIVEDNPGDVRLFKEILSDINNHNYIVEDVRTLEDSLTKSHQNNYDAVFIDLNLPDSFGIDTLYKFISKINNIPIIVLTGSDDLELAAKSLDAGAQDYLVKGQFDFNSLKRAIKYSIERNRIQKEKEELNNKLKIYADRWSSTFNAIEDAMSVINIDGKIIQANKAMCNLFQIDNKNIVGKICIDLLKDSDHQRDICSMELAKKYKTRQNHIFKINGKFFNCIVDPVLDENNNIVRMIHILSDVTQQKKAEEELEQNYKKIKKLFEQAIFSFGRLLEVKDPYTAGHQKNVAQIATLIAIDLDLNSEKIEAIRLASLVHDIGKIAIPASILSKPGKISFAEKSMIEMHPQIGYEILKEIDFSYPLAEIVLQHHEKIDGSGYPNKLKNGDILLEARILVVADVVEAMSSHRPYRPAHTIEETLHEIESNKGILYDPDVVDSCIRIFKSGKLNIHDLEK